MIDISALLDPIGGDAAIDAVAEQIDQACREVGFFGITGHGIDPALQDRLESTAQRFFTQPDEAKDEIAMRHAGPAWRGWFPVGGELTSGTPDRKEGLYFGADHEDEHPRVAAGTPLHGRNRFPVDGADLRSAVGDWLQAVRGVADAVMRGIAVGLGMPATWFEQHLTADPTVLFRIFHYPPGDPDETGQWGVGEHTDYGLLTLLAQDHHGGLQVLAVDGGWIDVAPTPGVIICNLGDMLERLTAGRYRSTPHRVRNTTAEGRLSFPYFFDPSWESQVPALPVGTPTRHAAARWDGADILAWEGTYGDYLTAKVARVFPELFTSVSANRSRESK